jgi:hypothetical protein
VRKAKVSFCQLVSFHTFRQSSLFLPAGGFSHLVHVHEEMELIDYDARLGGHLSAAWLNAGQIFKAIRLDLFSLRF